VNRRRHQAGLYDGASSKAAALVAPESRSPTPDWMSARILRKMFHPAQYVWSIIKA
jgi:hypothetical protein